MKIIELFGGIGACTQSLKQFMSTRGGNQTLEILDYVEIDKYAVKSYNAINGTNFETQDITQWNKHFDDVDLIMHGSPCQDFSLIGKQAGGDKDSGTRSSLMYETIRIVSDLKPKYVIWENVKNLLSKKHKHNFDAYLESMKELGYTNYYQVLNAKDYGIPQNRERVFTISIRNDIEKHFEFPSKQELKLKLKNLLEDEVDEKYYLSNKMIDYISDKFDKQIGTKWEGSTLNSSINKPIAMTIGCRSASQQRAGVTNYIAKNNEEEISIKDLKKLLKEDENYVYKKLGIRKLTPKECWRLMGFSDESFDKASAVNSNAQLYKQAGNSIVVNVLYYIFTKLLED